MKNFSKILIIVCLIGSKYSFSQGIIIVDATKGGLNIATQVALVREINETRKNIELSNRLAKKLDELDRKKMVINGVNIVEVVLHSRDLKFANKTLDNAFDELKKLKARKSFITSKYDKYEKSLKIFKRQLESVTKNFKSIVKSAPVINGTGGFRIALNINAQRRKMILDKILKVQFHIEAKNDGKSLYDK